MTTKHKKYFQTVFTLSIMLCTYIFQGCFKSNGRTIIVINDGMTSITQVVVTVCGSDYKFNNIPPSGQSQQAFIISGDSGFIIHGEFDDGSSIYGGFGYVTNNLLSVKVSIVIHEDGTVTGNL